MGDDLIIGRAGERSLLLACLAAERHVLLEGPVGVGKTSLARAVCAALGRPVIRVDGDGRYSEARLVGAFDPPAVLARGYRPDCFTPGPLLQAMEQGAALFINELNRMPEGVQNVLLPAMDEGRIQIPHLGERLAAPGFAVVATQNPAEFVATGALSEALQDRFELIRLGYQGEAEERAIVARACRCRPSPEVIAEAVAICRATREDPRLRRGASVRAAIAIADIAARLGGDPHHISQAALAALPTRVEAHDGPAALPDLLASLLDGRKKKLSPTGP